MATASNGYFAISKEVTAGTAITVPTHFLPVEEVDFPWENEFIDINLIQGNREAYLSLDGKIAPTASIKGPLFPSNGTGLIFLGLRGADTTAAIAPSIIAYKHTFGNAATIPYFTLERGDARSGEGGLLCERLAGCVVESVSVSAAFGEKVEFEAMFQAMVKPATASAIDAGDIVYPIERPLIFKGASLEIDDVANTQFKSINVEIKNTLARQDVLNATQQSYKILPGGQECTVSATMVFENLDMYNNLKNGTEFKLELDLVSATLADAATTPDAYYGLKFTWDIVRVARYSLPFKAGDVIEADVDFKIIYNETNARATLIEMTNLDDGAEYDGA